MGYNNASLNAIEEENEPISKSLNLAINNIINKVNKHK